MRQRRPFCRTIEQFDVRFCDRVSEGDDGREAGVGGDRIDPRLGIGDVEWNVDGACPQDADRRGDDGGASRHADPDGVASLHAQLRESIRDHSGSRVDLSVGVMVSCVEDGGTARVVGDRTVEGFEKR